MHCCTFLHLHRVYHQYIKHIYSEHFDYYYYYTPGISIVHCSFFFYLSLHHSLCFAQKISTIPSTLLFYTIFLPFFLLTHDGSATFYYLMPLNAYIYSNNEQFFNPMYHNIALIRIFFFLHSKRCLNAMFTPE